MRSSPLRALVCGLTLVMLVSCHRDEGRVAGHASYREEVGLPAGVVFEADLVQINDSAAERQVVASMADEANHLPVAFKLRFRPSALETGAKLAVDARLKLGDSVLYRTAIPVPVAFDKGFVKDDLDIVLVPAGADDTLAALKAAVSAIDARTNTLRRREGTFKEVGMSGSYVAYLDGDMPVLILEGRDLGGLGSSSIAFHFRDNALLRYAEDTVRHSASEPASKVVTSLKLYFDGERYVAGTKTIDGVSEVPDQHEINEAARRAGTARGRLSNSPAIESGAGAVTYACTDGAVFRSLPGEAGGVRLERLGRDPITLSKQPASTGTLYGDTMRSLMIQGGDAIWTAGDMPAVTCKRVADGTALKLSPGQFAVAALGKRPAGAWERDLLALRPAIEACLTRGGRRLLRVTRAAPIAGGNVSVSLQDATGSRLACIASADRAHVVSYDPVSERADAAETRTTAIFTPADGAYPDAPCFTTERVLSPEGTFLGWLSNSRC